MNTPYHLGLALLRVGTSALMLTHGYGKFMKLFSGEEIQFMNFLGLGPTISLGLTALGEFIIPIIIIVGFKTRLRAIFPAITMFVAAFVAHAGDPLSQKEMSLLYLIMFTSIALLGGGKFSLDGVLQKTNN